MKTKDAGWQNFLLLCQKESSCENLDELFSFFLTFEEKDQIATRVLLVRELLEKKKTQREIASELNISIAKITRGANLLKTLDNKVKSYLHDNLVSK